MCMDEDSNQRTKEESFVEASKIFIAETKYY